jgi:tetratricopeptide (TPR) repeat protein
MMDWHRRLLADCESLGQDFAALFHLQPLVDAAPDDPALRRRRAELSGRLGRWAEAEDDLGVFFARNPYDPDVVRGLAVLRARRGDRAGYRQLCGDLLRTAMRAPSPILAEPALQVATVAPGAVDDPAELVRLAERYAVSAPPRVWGPLSVLGAARLRAGEIEESARDLREALAAYGRDLRQRAGLLARGTQFVTEAAAVTPECDQGTPRDWLFLAMAERRLGNLATARAWLEKASRWIELASLDPPDPSVLGGMGEPTQRALARVQSALGAALTARGGVSRPGWRSHLPTWRQRLELSLLLEEAKAAVDGRPP